MPYEPHEVFRAPPRDAPMLRYMSFTKFVSMLDRRTLYFSRADLLGDRFEGSMSRANFRAADTDIRVLGKVGPEAAEALRSSMERARRAFLAKTYINCWTLSGYESVAMWRLYVGDGNGIAVESTFRRLTASLRREPRTVFAGKVKYIDYDVDPVPEHNLLYPFVRKRKSFEYEKEVRALIPQMFDAEEDEAAHASEGGIWSAWESPGPPGVHVPVDLSGLVVRVRVSPVSPDWFTELVRSVLGRYELAVDVAQSDIDGEPVY